MSQEKLRKYLQYAKTIKPEISEAASDALIEYYLSLRIPDSSGVISATARQLNGLFRITKSMAKLRLSDKCTIRDAEQAIYLHTASIEAFIDPRTGKLDIDLMSGFSTTQRKRIKQIVEIVKELQAGSKDDIAFIDDIVSIAKTKGISFEYVLSDIDHLKSEGDIIETSNGFFKAIQTWADIDKEAKGNNAEIFNGGLGANQRNRIRQLREIIKELQGYNKTAHLNDIVAKAEEKNMKREHV